MKFYFVSFIRKFNLGCHGEPVESMTNRNSILRQAQDDSLRNKKS